MRPSALVYFYRRRLRVHIVQELLAGVGVAVGVALVFAVIVANSSIASSATEVVHAVVGPATLQLRARDRDGFGEQLLKRVQRLPGVKGAVPLLEQTATIRGPDGHSVAVDVAGTTLSFAELDGLAHTLPIEAASSRGLDLSKALADDLGISASSTPGSVVLLELRGRATSLHVNAVLGREAAGALSQASAVIMPLARLQRLAGLPRRITRILIESQPGREASVRAELGVLAAGRLTVAAADQEIALLRQALHPSDQATEFFAAISALLGFLLAFNAILLTVPARRRMISDRRLEGATRTAIVQMVVFQALCLGLTASLVGLLAGYLISLSLLHQSPGYLAQAFTLGSNTVVGVLPALVALLGGVVTTCMASAVPLLDLRAGRALDGVYYEDGDPGNSLDADAQRKLFAIAVALALLATLLFALVPSLALVACVLLALATVLMVPLAFTAILAVADRLARRASRFKMLPVALSSLRATTLRSLALVTTGAVAIFGSVALGGARSDLLRGLRSFAKDYVADADIWVLNPGDTAAVNPFFADHYSTRIAEIPGVASVRSFQSEFMDVGDRRVWIIARPPNADPALLRSQLVSGDPLTAATHIREGGWVAASAQIAEEEHVKVGDELSVPTPSGIARFRLAAITTNFGWTAGAVLMNTTDYSRLWATTQPTALGITITPGASVTRVQRAIVAVLGPGSGLEALTAQTRAERFDAIAGEGLARLGDISTLLVIAAILAMAAALGSNIWQRRTSLAMLRLSGAPPHRLRRLLLLESSLILGTGCLTGAVAGIYGQAIIDGYLRHVTGFPVATLAASWRPVAILAVVVGAASVIGAAPGWVASRVSPTLALEE
jgi:putative ABC transport system permease protein